ncbi:MAG: hypothetical protein D6803_04400 [Anaerolineae bacterium]|nr:MAG: hypothetical protein D6803_04400 [Anaerolineae bacterium]
MLDDLREQADNIFLEDDQPEEDALAPEGERLFLGMTAVQRFVIAVMLFLMICILGSFCLLITERIYPPLL